MKKLSALGLVGLMLSLSGVAHAIPSDSKDVGVECDGGKKKKKKGEEPAPAPEPEPSFSLR